MWIESKEILYSDVHCSIISDQSREKLRTSEPARGNLISGGAYHLMSVACLLAQAFLVTQSLGGFSASLS